MKWILTIFIAFSTSTAFGINYFWCEKSADCVKAYGGCGRYFSVHRRYKELYESKAHKGDRVSFCKKPTEMDKQYKYEGEALCQKKRCRLTLKTDMKKKTEKL